MEKAILQEKVSDVAAEYGLQANIPEGLSSVGVGGDERTYTPIVILSGEFPGWDIIAEISNKITSTLSINRVTFEIGVRK